MERVNFPYQSAMDKRTFKICGAVALGLTHYYMGPHDKREWDARVY